MTHSSYKSSAPTPSTRKKTVWVLEDDTALTDAFHDLLNPLYDVRVFHNLVALVAVLDRNEPQPDALLADIRLGDENFIEWMKQTTQEKRIKAPFVVVSSVDDFPTLRSVFHLGAEDYLAKPFKSNELLIKLERLLGKAEFNLDAMKLEIRRGNLKPIRLTATELRIFSSLREAGGLLPRQDLIKKVWPDEDVTSKALDVHLFHLRKKLRTLFVEILFEAPSHFRLVFHPIDQQLPSGPTSNTKTG